MNQTLAYRKYIWVNTYGSEVKELIGQREKLGCDVVSTRTADNPTVSGGWNALIYLYLFLASRYQGS